MDARCKRGKRRAGARRAALGLLLGLGAATAGATEGGGNSYPMGVETNYTGLMLPDGAHWFSYYQYYSAHRSTDDAGRHNPQLASFDLHSQVLAQRLSYVWPGRRLLGARLETRVVLPLVRLDLDLAVRRPGGLDPLDRGGEHTGLGDMAFSPLILGWAGPRLHQTVGIDTHLRTGSYDVARRANTGRNTTQLALFHASTWFPAPGWDLHTKLRYAVNTRNSATGYRSGDEATFEFGAGWRATPALQLGVSGYVYRQTSDDEQNGRAVNGNGNRGRVHALGPAISYQLTPNTALIAKLQREFGAHNRPEGQRLWLQVKWPM
ncbi:SphA family protein [Pseudorhodoferax sp.]|uniref:SphA family protein n=1 Tax=Pseudorhodoferax sp. TaxID=1993553 RepID=UPI002DD683E9|nr:transporter [Pseudorhodoferax sp.]